MSDDINLFEYQDEDESRPQPKFSELLDVLKTFDQSRPNVTIAYGLSGLDSTQITKLKPIWDNINPAGRAKIMRGLVEISEADFAMDYRLIGFLGLDDQYPSVREAAIEVLWEDETLELMNRLIVMAENDEATEVRARAASALGKFILAGEYENLPLEEVAIAKKTVIGIWQKPHEDILVRRRALEAMSNSSDEIVIDAIIEAYNSPYQPMRVSSVFAMGCTYDERWTDYVMTEINSDDAEIRYEATRAAGTIGIDDAIPQLGKLTLEEDREIVEIAIWSLGEIGGEKALYYLNLLADKSEEEEDDDLLEAIEDAIATASFMAGMEDFEFDLNDDE